ncbi:unnamed protein product [Eruca vesicaria subsp. sativa]|uniref:Uncharacterized protein n=1 Tax=Eruca vesicaria subsp. sativa TaxID=29727 RepID=A0ABC8JY63_ERUVS|nr:unnamed protein product [Eruca vesicaria subsp. sativa]
MNRETKKLSQPQPPEKKEKKLKREKLPANPLRGFTTRSSGSSSCSNGSGSGSHRFLLSSSSSSLGVNPHSVRSVAAKTPKSAPVLSKPLIRKKPKSLEETKLKSTVTEKPQRCRTNPTFGKRVASGKIKGSVLKKQSSVSREVKLKDTVRVDDSVGTPVSKLGTGCDLVYRSNGDEGKDDGRVSNSNSSSSCREKTPPVQASVSPEMHCGTSMSLSASAQSQACYAAGHLLSGVSDKRKCKPKGILTVCENGFEVGKGKILNDSDEFDEGGFGVVGGSYDNVSMMPLPADASVHWLLSPCDEEKEKYDDDGFSQFQEIVECVGHESLSPLSDGSTSSDLCNISGGRSLSPMSTCKETMRRISSSLSPNELSRFRRFMQLPPPKCELEDPSEHLGGDKQSPLSIDTLGSENVIQTPESNSSFDSYLGLLCSQGEFKKKLEVGSDLDTLTSTLQSVRLSPRSHASPQKPSSSSFNFDSLATSSDSIDLSQFQRGLVKGDAPAGKGRELLPCSAAESISTDGGGGLICSEDSNWMACYNKS